MFASAFWKISIRLPNNCYAAKRAVFSECQIIEQLKSHLSGASGTALPPQRQEIDKRSNDGYWHRQEVEEWRAKSNPLTFLLRNITIVVFDGGFSEPIEQAAVYCIFGNKKTGGELKTIRGPHQIGFIVGQTCKFTE